MKSRPSTHGLARMAWHAWPGTHGLVRTPTTASSRTGLRRRGRPGRSKPPPRPRLAAVVPAPGLRPGLSRDPVSEPQPRRRRVRGSIFHTALLASMQGAAAETPSRPRLAEGVFEMGYSRCCGNTPRPKPRTKCKSCEMARAFEICSAHEAVFHSHAGAAARRGGGEAGQRRGGAGGRARVSAQLDAGRDTSPMASGRLCTH